MSTRAEKKIVFSSVFSDKTGGFSQLRNMMKGINGSLASVNRRFDQVNAKSNKLGGSFQSLGSKIGESLGVFSVLSGIGGFLSLQTAADFEEELHKINEVVKEISGARLSPKGLQELKGLAQEIGGSTQFSQTEVLRGMKLLGTSGWNKPEVMDSVRPVVELTGAAQINSLVELPEVSEKFSDVMAALGVKASGAKDFGDQVAYAFSNSNQTFTQLMDAIRVFSPIAKSIGITKEEALAFTMELSNRGIKETVAGTAMAGFVARMPKLPPEAQKIITAKFSKREYSGFFDLEKGKIKDLTKIFELFEKKKLTTGEVATIMGQEAGKYLISLVPKEVTEKIRENMKQLREKGVFENTAAKLNAASLKGLNGQIKLLTSAIDAFAVRLGDSGLLSVFKVLTQTATILVSALASIPNAILQPLTLGITALGSAFAVMFGVQLLKRAAQFSKVSTMFAGLTGAKMIPPFKGIAKVLNPIAFVFKILSRLLGFIFSLKGLLMAVVGGLAYIAWFMSANWKILEKKMPWLKVARNWVTELFDFYDTCIEKIKSFISSAGGWFKETILEWMGDPENKSGIKFNPYESQYERFEKRHTKEQQKVKVDVGFNNLPRGTQVKVASSPNVDTSLITGFAMETS